MDVTAESTEGLASPSSGEKPKSADGSNGVGDPAGSDALLDGLDPKGRAADRIRTLVKRANDSESETRRLQSQHDQLQGQLAEMRRQMAASTAPKTEDSRTRLRETMKPKVKAIFKDSTDEGVNQFVDLLAEASERVADERVATHVQELKSEQIQLRRQNLMAQLQRDYPWFKEGSTEFRQVEDAVKAIGISDPWNISRLDQQIGAFRQAAELVQYRLKLTRTQTDQEIRDKERTRLLSPDDRAGEQGGGSPTITREDIAKMIDRNDVEGLRKALPLVRDASRAGLGGL